MPCYERCSTYSNLSLISRKSCKLIYIMNQPCECNRLKLQLEVQVKENLGFREDLREMDGDRKMQQLQIADQNTHIDELQEALLEIEEKLNHMQSNIHGQRD